MIATSASNQPMKPTQHFVVSFRSTNTPILKVLGWLISLTHDLPSSFAVSGLPVYVAASLLAPFSLGL